MAHNVPSSVEELVADYDRFVFWSLRKFAGRFLDEDELLDLRQMVYVRVIERDFLSRCRAYYEVHEGRFITSLSALVRNVLYSYWKRRRSDPLRNARSIEDYRTQPSLFRFEGRIEAADVIDKLGRRLFSLHRDVQIHEVLAAALAVGDPCPRDIAIHLGMNPSTVRSHMAAARRAARRTDAFSTPTV
jgi:DNA-directed RNA polymerase specialized sigma24 family protein